MTNETQQTRPRSRMSSHDAARVARECAAELATSFPDLTEDAQAFMDTLDGETDALDVADRLMTRALAREELAEEVKYLVAQKQEAIAALRERQARFERQSAKLREGVLAILLACQIEGAKQKVRLERASYTASIRETAPSQRKLLTIDAAQTPPEFMKRPAPVPDTDAIRAALFANKDVPGWALANTSVGLQVRDK